MNINETKKEFGKLGRVERFRVDVSDQEDVQKQFKATVQCCGNVDILINCAGIITGMSDGVKSKLFPILKPEPTARKIMRAIERNTDFKGLPWGFHFIRFMQGILPTSWFDTILGKWCGIYGAMDHFTGRKNVKLNQKENAFDTNTDRRDHKDSESAENVLRGRKDLGSRIQKDPAA